MAETFPVTSRLSHLLSQQTTVRVRCSLIPPHHASLILLFLPPSLQHPCAKGLACCGSAATLPGALP